MIRFKRLHEYYNLMKVDLVGVDIVEVDLVGVHFAGVDPLKVHLIVFNCNHFYANSNLYIDSVS